MKLFEVFHPQGTTAYVGYDGKVYIAQEEIAPTKATDNSGKSVLEQLSGNDEFWNCDKSVFNLVDDDGDGVADNDLHNYLELEFPRKEVDTANLIVGIKISTSYGPGVFGAVAELFPLLKEDYREMNVFDKLSYLFLSSRIKDYAKESTPLIEIWDGEKWIKDKHIYQLNGHKEARIVYPLNISGIDTDNLKVRIVSYPWSYINYVAVDYSEQVPLVKKYYLPTEEKVLKFDGDQLIMRQTEKEITFVGDGSSDEQNYSKTVFLETNGYSLLDLDLLSGWSWDKGTIFEFAKDPDYAFRTIISKWLKSNDGICR
jgi:hypothetical protein